MKASPQKCQRSMICGGLPSLAAVLLASSFGSLVLQGQGVADYLVEGWSVEQGLPQNQITAVAQTADNYLWVGTPNGLARFDGVRFVVFGSDEVSSLSSDRVAGLAPTAAGDLWIATDGAGVVRCRAGGFDGFTTADGLSDNRVTAVCVNASGDMWAATIDGRLHRYVDGRFVGMGDAQPPVVEGKCTLAIDGTGRLWVGGVGFCGVVRGGKFQALLRKKGTSFVVARGRDDRMWVGAGSNLWEVDGATLTISEVALPKRVAGVTAIHEDEQGLIWIGTLGQGLLCRWAGKWEQFSTRLGLLHQYVTSIAPDDSGNLWVGTYRGLARIKPPIFDVFDDNDGLSHPSVLSVCEGRNGKLWVGTDGGGVDLIQGKTVRAFSVADGLRHESVWSVLEDRTGRLWVGSWGGGLQYKTGDRFESYGPAAGVDSSIIRALYEDRAGRVWAGSFDGGAYVFESGTFRSITTRDGLPGNDVRCLLEDRAGAMWFGTGSGLGRQSEGVISRFGMANGLPIELIRTLFEDSHGVLWVGTGGGGVAFLDGTRFRSVSASKGMVDDYIGQIFEDHAGNLWFGSAKGIFRARREEVLGCGRGSLPKVHCVFYNNADGLNRCNGGLQPAGWQTRDGRMLFATTTGLATVRPDRVVTVAKPPRVLIEEVSAGGAPLPLTADLRLPSHHPTLQFRYTAFSYSGPRRIQFRYKLDGRDSDWIEAGTDRTAVYSGLAPGRYQFRVTACNKDGVWNETGSSVALVIIPAVWQTWWFRLGGLTLGLVAIVLAMRQVLLRRVRRRLAVLEAEQALFRERARIAKDMHDDVGARLTQLAMLSDTVATSDPAVTAHKLGDLARHSVRRLDEIVWTLNPRNDDLDRLVDYFISYATEFVETAGLRCRIDAPTCVESRPVSSGTRHQILLAFKEALNNAVKHSAAGDIHVCIKVLADDLSVTVSDSGVGFEPLGVPSGGDGLNNMRERIASCGGRCAIESASGVGTSVSLVIPLEAIRPVS